MPKGIHDIRMVYDASRSGLNDAVWAPWFPMPTVNYHLRAVEVGTFMADCDVGELFFEFYDEPGDTTICRDRFIYTFRRFREEKA